MSVVVPVARPITLAVSEATTATSSILDPTDLFFSGETGTFLDFTTPQVYADTAGTDPAEVGEGVALTLDKSQGLVLGPELVTNGTFDTDVSGWDAFYTQSGGSNLSLISFNNGTIAVDASVANVIAEQGITTNIGSFYRFTGSVTELASGNRYWIQISDAALTSGTTLIGPITSAQDFDLLFVASATTTYVQLHVDNIGDGTASFDNISVREIPGVHALQATSTARPIFARVPRGGRRNLLERTEDFSNAVWGKTNLTASGDRVTANAGTFAAYVEGVISLAAGNYTISFIFPPTAGRNRYVWIGDRGIVGIASATFDLDSVSVIGSNAPATPSITTLADGSVRCGISYTRPAVGTSSPQFALAGASHTSDRPVLTFAGTEFLEVKAQLELGSTATPYQKVTTQYDITESGIHNVYHSVWDNTDDILPITLPAITGGTVALVGLNGIWIEDNWDYAGGTLSIGPRTIAGLPARILDVVGDLCAVIINDRAWTAAERAGVVAWGKARGAPGVFSLGPELVTNGDFSDGTTGWTFSGSAVTYNVTDGVVTVNRNGGTASKIAQDINTEVSSIYIVSAEISNLTGSVLLGIEGQGSLSFSTPVTAQRTFAAAITTTEIGFVSSGDVNGVFSLDNISVRKLELIP